MHKGEVRRVLLLVLVLFMTACTQTQPKVENQKELNSKIEKKDQSIELTKLSADIATEERWVPLKIEDEVEWNAKELLGKKYVWGATGPKTYDCSGFTQKIYDDLGIKLPRVSRDQAKQGKLLKFKELKKGDLVFFHTNRRRPKRVTHVGIYLGEGNFIHASSGAKKIVICNFKKDKFYKKSFLWGRRVIEPKQHIATTQEAVKTAEKSL